jgi:hypothetical protein
MKGYYIVYSNTSSPLSSGGIGKKIKSQIETFNSFGLNVEVLSLHFEKKISDKITRNLMPNYYIKHLPADFLDRDFFYIRHYSITFSFIGLLKYIHKHGNAKIILELPTYPYDKEYTNSINNYIKLLIDIILRRSLKKYVNRITTFSNGDTIFGIKTIKIVNGVKCSELPVRPSKKSDQNINLIAVARFSKWHGYDRLIYGLHNYYGTKKNTGEKVFLYLIGEGSEIALYKKLVNQFNLTEYVFFEGFLEGDRLNAAFNNAGIGVCSLGCHRNNIYLGSFLKSREYLARGIPIVSSTKIDIIPANYKYCLYLPGDESPIDISSIVKFYTELYKNNSLDEITREIRAFAEEYCDVSNTMRPVIQYLTDS